MLFFFGSCVSLRSTVLNTKRFIAIYFLFSFYGCQLSIAKFRMIVDGMGLWIKLISTVTTKPDFMFL